ncbi:hypothetical protein Tco_0712430 [Tanacetum coccineum]
MELLICGSDVAPKILADHTLVVKGSKRLLDLCSTVMEPRDPMNVETPHGYIDNLERLGHPVTLGLAIINELHAMLSSMSNSAHKNNALLYLPIRAGKSRKVKRNNKPATPKGLPGDNNRGMGDLEEDLSSVLSEFVKKRKNASIELGGGSGYSCYRTYTFFNQDHGS